jgi:polyribonucleotide nucleotidyltransferase
MGKVVNITKFGAFVNIMPGRDGLVHISKLGRGKRINNVEDVLQLGQEIEVVVEEIDEKGKVSLTPSAAWGGTGGESGGDEGSGDAPARARRAAAPAAADGLETVSFADSFDAELAGELGDLGPGGEAGGNSGRSDGGDRGGRGDDRNRRRRR